MSPELDRVLNDAMRLSESDRAELAGRLIFSLDDDLPDGEVEEGYHESWAAEIARRIEEMDRGTAKMIPWDEARRMIYSKQLDDDDPAN